VQTFISNYGYLAIFVLMLAESACIPVPSELIMTFGGALAAGAVPGTHLNLIGVILATAPSPRCAGWHRGGGAGGSGSGRTTSTAAPPGSTGTATRPC